MDFFPLGSHLWKPQDIHVVGINRCCRLRGLPVFTQLLVSKDASQSHVWWCGMLEACTNCLETSPNPQNYFAQGCFTPAIKQVTSLSLSLSLSGWHRPYYTSRLHVCLVTVTTEEQSITVFPISQYTWANLRKRFPLKHKKTYHTANIFISSAAVSSLLCCPDLPSGSKRRV